MAFWYFPSNDHGENKGINDSGVATFRGTPLKSLAREICQNSLDAAIEKTVRIDFSAFEIEASKVPGSDVLKDTFEKCASYWSGQKGKTTKDFFANAIDKITAPKIAVLRISDFHTKGLTGSKDIKDINTDWMRLTKSSGSSDKKGPAGGSFGIGKFAPFACSDFSTVFYSTYDSEDQCAYQGVSRLVTFERDDGETTQGTGYYGNEKNTPVFESLNIDPSFNRGPGDYGTDIYIAGYKYGGNDWEDAIVISIIDGFIGAIWNEKLVVNVGDVKISKATLPELMETYGEELEGCYANEYYAVLTSDKTSWFEEPNHMGLGQLKFGVLLGSQEFHRKAAMIRQTGMKIKDGDRLSGYIPFAAVLFIEGDKLNEKLRLIENPEHTEWQPERSNAPIEARQLVKSIHDYMKQCIDELAEQGNQGEMDAVGVGDFLPDEPDGAEENSKEEAVTDKVFSIDKRVLNKNHLKEKKNEDKNVEQEEIPGKPEDGGEDEDWVHPDDPNPHPPTPRPPQPSHIEPDEEKKTKTIKEIKVQKVLPLCTDAKKGKYILVFVPDESAKNGSIVVNLSGETDSYKATIKNVSLIGGSTALEINDNKIQGYEFVAGQAIKMNIELDYYDFCPMEVKAYAYKA